MVSLCPSLFLASLPAWIWTWRRKSAGPGPGGGTPGRCRASPRRHGRLAPEGGGSTKITPCAPQEVAMDDRLSWDELYPFMDEVKALARGPPRCERVSLLRRADT